MVVFLADVKLAAEDGLDSLLFRRVEEVHRAIDVAVIGHGDGGLAQRVDVLHQLVDIAGAVQQGVIGVQVQVGKLGSHASSLVPPRRRVD